MNDSPSPGPAPGVETRRLQGAVERALFGTSPPPVRVGRFALLELLGEGGMGRVYLAYDPRLDRRVAVKLLHGSGRELGARLAEEALALARLNHPNVVTVYEVGDHDDGVFVAMEYVDGGTLERWCEPDEFPRDRWRAVVALAEQAAQGLIAAHAVNIVHRDLKPANMLIGSDGRLRLADFGLARALDEKAETPRNAGTPAYMAPEQFEGVADARSDQFSLCASFLHVLYGRRCHRPGPGQPTDDAEAAKLVASLASRSAVPRHVEVALLRGISSDPARRFPDVSSLAVALLGAPNRRRWWIGGGVAVTALALGALALGPPQAPQCSVPEGALAKALSDERVAAARRGVLSSGLRHAPATADHLERELARIAARWQEQRAVACAAERSIDPARVRSGAAQRTCLLNAVDTIDALTTRMLAPDAEGVTRTPDALVLLADLTDCHAAREVAELDDGRGPALLQVLHEGRIADELDDEDSATAAFTRILDETQSGELPRLRAMARRQLATHYDRLDRLDEKREHDRGWLDEAEAAGDAELAAGAWASIATSLVPPAPYEYAQFHLERARGYARRGRLSEAAVADIDVQAAQVALAHGQLDDAAAALTNALAVLEGEQGTGLARALKLLTDVQIARDAFDEAVATRRRATTLLEARLGPDHPDVASMNVSLAEAHGLAQDEASALALLDQVVDVLDASPSLRPFNRAIALVSRGTARANLGQFELALTDLERADDLLGALLPADDPARILALDPMARALVGIERRGQAVDVIDRALGHAHPDDAVTRHDLSLLRAEVLAEDGHTAEAELSLERAIALRALAFQPSSVSWWQATEETARVLVDVGRPDRALAEIEAARTADETMPEAWVFRFDVARARALLARGDRDGALALARALRARAAAVEVLPRMRDDLTAVLTALGESAIAPSGGD